MSAEDGRRKRKGARRAAPPILLTHLKLGRFKVGLLVNFNERHLKDGIRRRVNALSAVSLS